MRKRTRLKDVIRAVKEDVFHGTPYFDEDLQFRMELADRAMNLMLDRMRVGNTMLNNYLNMKMKGGRTHMKKKKSPSKLKLATTAKAKKALKAKKK